MGKSKFFITVSFGQVSDATARRCVCQVLQDGTGSDGFGGKWRVITDDFGGTVFVKQAQG